MRSHLVTVAVLFALALPAAAPLRAQSLADIARKEEERRKTIKEPAKVYTNQDLASLPPLPSPSTLSSATDTSAKKSDADKDVKDDKTADKPDPSKDPAAWRSMMQAAQTQLDRDQSFLDALQSRINALTTDFVNRDDPAQRAVIERDRQKALAELDRLKKSIVDDKKAIADVEEQARRAGVPPGWLR